jgi:hypothetical protein
VLLRVLGDHVLRLELSLRIHAELALGEVADVPEGSPDRVVRAEVALQGLGFGRRLHDHERLRHSRNHLFVMRGGGTANGRAASGRRVPASRLRSGMFRSGRLGGRWFPLRVLETR